MDATATTQTTDAQVNFSFANKFNKTTFDVDTTDFEFVKLSALYAADNPKTPYRLDGFWINRSQLGEQPVLICAEIGKLVNAPMHYCATFNAIKDDANAVDAIKNGKVGFTVYKYESHARECYGIKFTDLK